MIYNSNSKKIILLIGDAVLLYFGLFFALAMRDISMLKFFLIKEHLGPFSIINFLWLIIFFIAGFYEIEKRTAIGFAKILIASAWSGIIAVLLFYLFPFFGIAPKTILIIDIIISSGLVWTWRKFVFYSFTKAQKTKIFFWNGAGEQKKEIKDFKKYLEEKSHLGYETTDNTDDAQIIVVSEEEKQKNETLKAIYKMVWSGKTSVDFEKFYESITGKVPVSIIGERWFLDNLQEISKQTFEKMKRLGDIVFSLVFFILLAVIFPFATIAIKLNSQGPIFYRQKRIGKDGKIFEVIKFRSMIEDAEKNGAQWADKKDNRITFIGNILRKTRVDEIPQVINVLKGDLSFVGPRPERPEFMEELGKKIPHYHIRHIIKPGLTGWAQINFPYGASVEDAMEKLQYDLFYIKNRSLTLELSIILKTIMTVLRYAGR